MSATKCPAIECHFPENCSLLSTTLCHLKLHISLKCKTKLLPRTLPWRLRSPHAVSEDHADTAGRESQTDGKHSVDVCRSNPRTLVLKKRIPRTVRCYSSSFACHHSVQNLLSPSLLSKSVNIKVSTTTSWLYGPS